MERGCGLVGVEDVFAFRPGGVNGGRTVYTGKASSRLKQLKLLRYSNANYVGSVNRLVLLGVFMFQSGSAAGGVPGSTGRLSGVTACDGWRVYSSG